MVQWRKGFKIGLASKLNMSAEGRKEGIHLKTEEIKGGKEKKMKCNM